MSLSDIIEEAPLNADEKGRAKFLADFGELMGGATFRRWLQHLIEAPNWCAADACNEDPDSVARTFTAAGKRHIGVALKLTAMAVGDENYKRMLLEAISIKKERELREDFEKRERMQRAPK